jgi:flagellar export protein FliJ
MRRRFRFRLERVLAERRRVEKIEQQELAVLLDTLAGARRRHAEVMARVAALRRLEGEQLDTSSCSVHEWRLVRADIDAFLAQLAELGREIRWLEDAVVRQRQRLAESARQRRLLERLRERALAEYQLNLRRAEAAVLDDIGRPEPATVWSR